MRCREMTDGDVVECLAIEPRHLGAELVGRERAIALWQELTRSRSFNSVVVENEQDGRVLAFGGSVFVTAEFAEAEMEAPRPYISSRIFASVGTERTAVYPQDELCNGHRQERLYVVILAGNQRDDLTDAQRDEARMLLAYRFVEAHVGYPLERVLMESVGEEQRLSTLSSGVWREVCAFREENRALLTLARESAFSATGSIAGAMFQYQAPVLGLHDTHKQLLGEALLGGTDAELAERMKISPAALKKRWKAVFDRIAETRPALLPAGDQEDAMDARGRQKRHHVVNYVRSHPEEIRPFRWHSTIPM